MFCKKICKMTGGGIAYGFGNLTDRKIGVGQQMLGMIQTNVLDVFIYRTVIIDAETVLQLGTPHASDLGKQSDV